METQKGWGTYQDQHTVSINLPQGSPIASCCPILVIKGPLLTLKRQESWRERQSTLSLSPRVKRRTQTSCCCSQTVMATPLMWSWHVTRSANNMRPILLQLTHVYNEGEIRQNSPMAEEPLHGYGGSLEVTLPPDTVWLNAARVTQTCPRYQMSNSLKNLCHSSHLAALIYPKWPHHPSTPFMPDQLHISVLNLSPVRTNLVLSYNKLWKSKLTSNSGETEIFVYVLDQK